MTDVLGVLPFLRSILIAAAVACGPVAVASSRDPASWDKDRAHAMFDTSVASDTIGVPPIWSLAVADSGRRAEVVANRFREERHPPFPVDSVFLRRTDTHALNGSLQRPRPEIVMLNMMGGLRVSAN